MKITILASGSKGNCAYIKTNNTSILIDAGISYRQMVLRYEKICDDSFFINGVVITHEHTDHINGIGTLLNRFDVPVFLSENSFNALKPSHHDKFINRKINYINPLECFNIGDIKITPIEMFHDAKETYGYIIESNNKKIVYITDTGYVHKEVYEYIKNADLYVIEANHDPERLMNSDRPIHLKRRILGDKGHLSNQDAIATICYVLGPKTKKIVLAHISSECNCLDALDKTIKDVFNDFSIDNKLYEIIYASQDESTRLIEV